VSTPTEAFSKLAQHHWLPSAPYGIETGREEHDVRRGDVRTHIIQANADIKNTLDAAGFIENTHYHRRTSCRFVWGSMLRQDIGKITLTAPELIDGVTQARRAFISTTRINPRRLTRPQREALEALQSLNWARSKSSNALFITAPQEGLSWNSTSYFVEAGAEAEAAFRLAGLQPGVQYAFKNLFELADAGTRDYLPTLAVYGNQKWLHKLLTGPV